jgi:hypothetical protein
MRARVLFTAAAISVLGFVSVFPVLGWAQQSTSQYVTMKWSFKSTYPHIVALQLYESVLASDRHWPFSAGIGVRFRFEKFINYCTRRCYLRN